MKKNVIYLLILLLIIACSASNNDNDTNSASNNNSNSASNNNSNGDEWLIPKSEVIDGGPGKDGIPSLDFPAFVSLNQASYINPNDLVIGIVNGNEAKAYPHKILDWHEIANDEIEGEFITINYCPLTGTAFGWESKSNGVKTTFGVSGLLYNTNLILYDRNTDSNWAQLRLEAVNGELIGNKPTLTQVIETNWTTWQSLYPNSKVLSLNTGFSRNYDLYPYGDYKTNHSRFLFSVSPSNSALPNKQRIFAIIDSNKSKVYQFSNFENGNVFKDTFNGNEYLIVGDENLITAFKLNSTYLNLDFEYAFNNSEVFFKDNEGNAWSVFGKALSGPRTGETLTTTKSVISYWFAIAAFYPNPIIYSE